MAYGCILREGQTAARYGGCLFGADAGGVALWAYLKPVPFMFGTNLDGTARGNRHCACVQARVRRRGRGAVRATAQARRFESACGAAARVRWRRALLLRSLLCNMTRALVTTCWTLI